jgi:hypothetical protein
VFGFLHDVVIGLSLRGDTGNGSESTLLADQELSMQPWAVHNEVMSLGPVEIFFFLVIVGLVAYVLWRLLIRPRRIRPPR